MLSATRTSYTAFSAVALLGATACSEDPIEPVAQNIVELAEASGFSTLITALDAAGLTATLEGPGPFTVFAPTNAAFDALPAGTLDGLLADPQALSEVLLYHVVSGDIRAADLSGVVSATTAQGQPVLFDLSAGVQVNGANVTQADIVASNGVIHVIDAVLLPPANNIVEVAAANPDFSTLVTALQAAQLDGTLAGPGPFTVFAPTNEAFDALPAGTLDALLADTQALSDVLLYHVANGRGFAGDLDGSPVTTIQGADIAVDLSTGVRLNGAAVTIADLLTTNGVIHVIDAVLLPPTP